MSGAAGHLMHLHENRSLTFNEIIDVLTLASEGRLENVTEKLDGINIVFTWNDELRIARNSTDLKTRGMNYHDLSIRFRGRGNIQNAFIQAFHVLQHAMTTLTRMQVLDIFGTPEKQRWYSAEIIYPVGINTINYDCNAITFHGNPVFEVCDNKVSRLPHHEGSEVLKKSIETMQKAVQMRGWKIMGPVVANLQKMSDQSALYDAGEKIDSALVPVGLSRDATIQEYLLASATDYCIARGISQFAAKKMALRLINVKGADSVSRLVKMLPKSYAPTIIDIIQNDKSLIASFMQPIEIAISDFACSLLKNVQSILVSNPTSEIERLRAEVNDAIDEIRNERDIEKLAVLEKHLLKLGNVNNLSSVEGVVFMYKGSTYKFTGAWAPIHQILSLCRGEM